MPAPLYTPRLNNNDDYVRLTHLFVAPGAFVRKGDPIADVETDKAGFTVEADQDGYVLGFTSEVGQTIEVGSVLAWFGAQAEEAIPADTKQTMPRASAGDGSSKSTTLKAAILLAQHGLLARDVPASGERLTASDVENYVASHGGGKLREHSRSTESKVRSPFLAEAGHRVDLTPAQHGMLRTVAWHGSEAVPAYLELGYDPAPWIEYAAAFQKKHRLLLSPLLALMTRRLVGVALEQNGINATLLGEQKHVYDHVNVGFTVQSGDNLMVVVVGESEKLEEITFVQKLGELQRRAMKNQLHPDETSGATIGFSSMGRWAVSRHVPILLPQTSLMLAHTATVNGAGCLGATYDHRILNGGEIVRALQALSRPPDNTEQ